MAGYTRQDTANNIANGNVIDADDFDAEYNAVEGAFNASTGHKHDGTSGEGAPITKVGPSQDLIVSATNVLPKTTNTLDLGSSGAKFKDSFFDGTVTTDDLAVTGGSVLTGNATVGGTLGVTGATTLSSTAAITGNTTVGGTLGVTGASTLDSAAVTNNATVGGTLGVTGNTTVGGTLGVTGQITGNITGAVTGNASTATALQTARSITIDGDVDASATNFDGTGNITLTTTLDTVNSNVGSFGSSTAIPVVTVNGKGLVTGVSTASIATALTVGADSGSDDSVALATDTLNFVGTANEIETAVSNNQIQIGLPSAVTVGSLTTSGNVIVGGDLTVSGTTTTVNTETINLADNQILLNSNETGTPSQNGGIEIERGTSTNKTLVWNETDDKWTVGSETFVAGTFEGALIGNVTGDVTGDVTGASSSDLTLSTAADMLFKSANTVFNFQHTSSANAAKPPQLNIKNTDTATAADQLIGEFRFIAANSLGSYVDYASFKSKILDNDSSQRDGSFVMTVSNGGTNDFEVFSAGGGQNTIIKSPLNIQLKADVSTITNSAGTGTLTFTPNSSSQVISSSTDLRLTGTDIRIDATTNVKLEGTTTDVFGDLVLSKGASDWKVEVNGSNELVISYGGVNKMKLDTSGNLTVTGDVTAFGTV